MNLEEDLQKAWEAKDKANQELVTIQKRIKDGESLGNPIKDYLFILYGSVDQPEVEKQLQDFQRKIQSFQGQRILVLHKKRELTKKGGCFGSDRYTSGIREVHFGVIGEPLQFDLNNGNITIPTENHLSRGPFFSSRNAYGVFGNDHPWEKKEGPITIGYLQFLNMNPFHTEENLHLQTIMGNDKVELYFTVGDEGFYTASMENDSMRFYQGKRKSYQEAYDGTLQL